MARKLAKAALGQPRSPARYRQVQGLIRGLSFLSAFKNFAGATASIPQLSQQTGLHRTTVKRLLETLKEVGYVNYVADSKSYRLTFRIRQLSKPYRDETFISEIADPLPPRADREDQMAIGPRHP